MYGRFEALALVILVLAIPFSAYAGSVCTTRTQESITLRKYVIRHLKKIEKDGARMNSRASISIDPASIECLANAGNGDYPGVGVCTASGMLDYPNSDSLFAITIREKDPGFGTGQRKISVQILSAEI